MGVRSRKAKRKKSSDSDLNSSQYKQSKYGGSSDHDHDISLNLSQVIGEASAVLYSSNEETSLVFDAPSDFPTLTCPTPEKNMATMKGGTQGSGPSDTPSSKWDIDKLSVKMDMLMESVIDIKKGQDSLRITLDSKIDKLRKDLLINIDEKVRSLRDDVTIEIGRESLRIDNLMRDVQSMKCKIDSVENKCNSMDNGDSTHSEHHTQHMNPIDDPDLTITASGLPYTQGECILDKAKSLTAALGDEISNNVTVIAAKRLNSRLPNRPGIVKISFASLSEKIRVLRNKMKLIKTEQYKKTFLKSSKSHAERLIEINTRALLREIPNGRNFRVDANGRLRQRNYEQTLGDDAETRDA